VTLAATLGFIWLYGSANWIDTPLSAPSYFTFTQNFVMAWRGEIGTLWLLPTWTLAVEEQFYLLLPLWRLRRATTIESGLFKIQARHLLRFRQQRRAHLGLSNIIDTMYRKAVATEDDFKVDQDDLATNGIDAGSARLRRLLTKPIILRTPCPPVQPANLSARPAQPL
jgi:hypothetical protein